MAHVLTARSIFQQVEELTEEGEVEKAPQELQISGHEGKDGKWRQHAKQQALPLTMGDIREKIHCSGNRPARLGPCQEKQMMRPLCLEDKFNMTKQTSKENKPHRNPRQ